MANVVKEWAAHMMERWPRRGGVVDRALIEWTVSYWEYEEECSLNDIYQHLATVDCAACHAPPGLIYSSDLAAKVGDWWMEINAALEEYYDEVSEIFAPRDRPLTVGDLVWFAVEWFAGRMADETWDMVEKAGEARP